MPAFDLETSMEIARRRLGGATRRTRSDLGRSRLDPAVLLCVERVLGGQERPGMGVLLEQLARSCRQHGLIPPSRATVYKMMNTATLSSRRWEDLPVQVRGALYNLGPGSLVPGRQIAFYCFNYGDLAAMSYAAGLPWIALWQALRLPGWRSRSRGLAEAVATVRRIIDGRA